ncbi:putative ankyrin repeat protein [Acanthamoeba polyphaga mimivirus]|uniref:Ankyrin repeat protein n=1 Tax=Acanthamoeba polyphaga mimivirus Kroon TaxID=3069720 RepID=A0A0G2Y5H1_9VIRU|nr:putative ankyrin repeat protein [Acanthamoeba polyphaga mimivirus]AKI79824.1 putative ankyrin repeat protein [Acanthamoeba polyphaga mimivirus Kroon]
MSKKNSFNFNPEGFSYYDHNRIFPYCHDKKCKNFSKLMYLIIKEKIYFNGHSIIIEYLNQNKNEINHQNEHGWTALMIASVTSNYWCTIDTVKLLLENGADPNIPNNKGETALGLVVSNLMRINCLEISQKTNYLKIAQLLIEYGANVNFQNNSGDYILNHSLRNNNFDIIKILLDNNTNPNLSNNKGNTLLHNICIHGESCDSIINLLLNYNVDLNSVNLKRKTALMYLCKYHYKTNNINSIELLLKNGANPNIQNHKGNTAIMYLFSIFLHEYGSLKYRIIKLLLQYGADPNIKNNDEISVLLIASTILDSRDSKNIIKNLLKHGANPNIINNQGLTFLMLLVKKPQNRMTIEYLDFFLKYIDPNIQCGKGKNILHYIPSGGIDPPDILRRLLEFGTNPNARDYKGRTPLMLACKKFTNISDIVKVNLLVQYSIIGLTDYSGKKALDYAMSNTSSIRVIIVSILLERGDTFDNNSKNDPLSKCLNFVKQSSIAKQKYDTMLSKINIEANKFILRPDSIRTKILTVNWYLEHSNVEKLTPYNYYQLMEYLGATDIDDLKLRITENINHMD